jgi:uncharacterized membrane protein
MLYGIRQVIDFALPFLDQVPFLREILGFILVFFLPGFTWTLIFLRQFTVIERMVLSFGLSIAVVTLVVCALNLLFGVRINGLNSLLTIVVITAVPVIPYCVMRFGVSNEKS